MNKLVTLLSCALFLFPNAVSAEDATWQLEDWGGPAVTVHSFVPEGATTDTPIVIVMHGWSRDVERYFNDWRALGEEHGLIVAVPHFPKDDFPTSTHYNLGHVFERDSGELRPREQWTFATIERVFDEVVARSGSTQTQYTIFGHSAGSQFVHRYLYYMPNARVKRYLAANAGWYTMPDFNTEYPYGLEDAEVNKQALADAFGKDMVILLGREDIDHTDSTLRNTSEAKRQGKNRFARGLTFYAVARITAEKLGVDLNWRLVTVDDAGHVNAEMAPAAARLVE